MKKLTCILSMMLCFIASNSFAQSASKSFKEVTATYNLQVKQFFIDVFELQKTGEVIETTMREELETKIYEAMLVDFASWKDFSIKHQGDKKFILELKSIKGFEPEAKEYVNQFKNFQKDFVNNRMTWTEAELAKVLTKEELQKFIDPVMKKFEERTKKLFEKLAKT
ncbi:MAG TPA: hypothetical protein PKC87_01785 [Candidatus Absconditabacterales bacterium]|nr:hypothetical protein [Candidatus Absconditabacterales bacterium]